MSERMLVVIAYDTPDDDRRRRISKTLHAVADRVQWSVFEGWLTDEQLEDLWQRLMQLCDADQDCVRLYRVCRYCRRASRQLGGMEQEDVPGFWIV